MFQKELKDEDDSRIGKDAPEGFKLFRHSLMGKRKSP